VFDQVAGVLIGDFSESSKEDDNTYSLEDFMQEYFTGMKVPVMSNVKCGHCYPTATIPLGLTCTIDTNRQIVKFSR
jgi:muramoyltetrapeptide carboxypeptidase